MFGRNRFSMGLLNDSMSFAKIEKDKENVELAKLNLSDIIQVDFPDDQYYRQQTTKKQIVLHHTVSGQGVNGDIAWWRSTAAHVATAILVDYKGKIYQCFSSKYWGHHLGVHASNNVALNKAALGIEIDSWGGLVRSNRLWYPAKWDNVLKRSVANTSIAPIKNVQVYPNAFRGFYGFEKYTDEQIESVRQLLVFWGEKYDIPLNYNSTMFEISHEALSGKSGIWSHTSFRSDKSDIHPDDGLVKMLKALK